MPQRIYTMSGDKQERTNVHLCVRLTRMEYDKLNGKAFDMRVSINTHLNALVMNAIKDELEEMVSK